MTTLYRHGVCNRCGQCCGAEGSPHQHNPWPGIWPESLYTWQLDNLVAKWPHALLFGIISKGDGTIGPSQTHGSVRVTGKGGGVYHYVWVPGHAACKDISEAHDGSEYSLECPFLKPDPGDGTRPCGLVGTNENEAFRLACHEGHGGLGIPRLQIDDKVRSRGDVITAEEIVARWFEDHPACSFTWTATPP